MFNSVEEAYSKIGAVLAEHAVSPDWQCLRLQAPVYLDGCGGMTTTQCVEGDKYTDLSVGFAVFDIQEAVLYLRDDLLKATGDRIWGFNFTLYPTGKFRIDYDYNKPEGYEETDEMISVEDALSSLQSVLNNTKAKD